MKRCPHCGGNVPTACNQCTYCGKDIRIPPRIQNTPLKKDTVTLQEESSPEIKEEDKQICHQTKPFHNPFMLFLQRISKEIFDCCLGLICLVVITIGQFAATFILVAILLFLLSGGKVAFDKKDTEPETRKRHHISFEESESRVLRDKYEGQSPWDWR